MSTGLLTRTEHLITFEAQLRALLKEKCESYGAAGGFYDTNKLGDYRHAIGEAILKLKEFERTQSADVEKRHRLLLKAAAWIYLIIETEAGGISEQHTD